MVTPNVAPDHHGGDHHPLVGRRGEDVDGAPHRGPDEEERDDDLPRHSPATRDDRPGQLGPAAASSVPTARRPVVRSWRVSSPLVRAWGLTSASDPRASPARRGTAASRGRASAARRARSHPEGEAEGRPSPSSTPASSAHARSIARRAPDRGQLEDGLQPVARRDHVDAVADQRADRPRGGWRRSARCRAVRDLEGEHGRADGRAEQAVNPAAMPVMVSSPAARRRSTPTRWPMAPPSGARRLDQRRLGPRVPPAPTPQQRHGDERAQRAQLVAGPPTTWMSSTRSSTFDVGPTFRTMTATATPDEPRTTRWAIRRPTARAPQQVLDHHQGGEVERAGLRRSARRRRPAARTTTEGSHGSTTGATVRSRTMDRSQRTISPTRTRGGGW